MQQMIPKFFSWPVSFDAPKQWKCLIDSILVWGSGPTQNDTFGGMVSFSTPQLSESVDGYLSDSFPKVATSYFPQSGV